MYRNDHEIMYLGCTIRSSTILLLLLPNRNELDVFELLSQKWDWNILQESMLDVQGNNKGLINTSQIVSLKSSGN